MWLREWNLVNSYIKPKLMSGFLLIVGRKIPWLFQVFQADISIFPDVPDVSKKWLDSEIK